MKYLLSAAALTAAAAVIGIFAGTASADQAPKQPSAEAIEAKRAQARRNLAAAQVCGGSAWTMENNVLTCHKEIEQ
jgi:hypothetical protein